MPKIEIISASGNIKTTVNSNFYKILSSGEVIKLTVAKNEISGSQKVKNDLILTKSTGEKIILEDFFTDEGKEKNKLVVEDQGQLWLADYDAQDFTGLSFAPVASMSDVTEAGSDFSTAAWLVPLIGVAAVGAGVALHNRSDGSGGHKSNKNSLPEKQVVDDAQKTLEAGETDLNQAQKLLNDAAQAMKNNPDAASVETVSNASSGLQNAILALEAAGKAQSAAIVDAKAKGIDTTAAEKAGQQAQKALSDASVAIDKASQLSETAQALTAAYPQATINSLQVNFEKVQSELEKVKTLPTEENIEASVQYQELATNSLAELQSVIKNLQQVIQKAQEQGFNVTQSTALMEGLQQQYEQVSKSVSDTLAQAHQNQQDVAAAITFAQTAHDAVEKAEQEKALASEKLSAALALKALVLENNELSRVDEVNQSITQANKALEAAREAASKAGALVQAARDSANKIDASVDPSLKPEVTPAPSISDLKAIDKGVVGETHKTFFDALHDYALSFVNTAKEVYQQIADSKPTEIIQSVISDVLAGLGTVGELVTGKIGAIVDSVKIAFEGAGDLAGAEFKFFGDLFNLAVSAVKDTISASISGTVSTIYAGFDGVVSGISQGISDALKDMGLLDWINPIKWIGLVKDVIFNSVGNVVSNLVDVVKAIPGNIIDFIGHKITEAKDTLGKDFSDKFDIVKNAVTDIVKTVSDAFIQQPFEKLLKPVIDKVADIMSHPFESVQALISTIVETVKDSIDIVKALVSIPDKILDNTATFIKEMADSLNENKVIDGDGKEIQALAKPASDDKQNSAGTEIKSLLKSSDSTGDISLDKVVPATAHENLVTVNNIASISAETFHMPLSNDDSHTSAIPVAA
ncbi:BapA/Bap/LapF family prefix-like domain-containing protein [Pantoea agglomerans]|uniref:BapA/Bap/LapF family prefix-like domain-containing protein n=1 Tax=Enterobacter agglomerans TaxID=549 RepID=UPI003C79DC21